MTEKFSVTCSECFASLSIPENKIGKKLRCPKCQGVFTAEASDEETADDLDDEMSEEEEKPAKRGKPAGGRAKAGNKKSAKKGKSSEGGSFTGLIVTCVVGLLVITGGGLYFSGVFGKKNVPQPTATASSVAPVVPDSKPAATQTAPAAPTATAEHTAPEKPTVPVAEATPAIAKPAVPAAAELSPAEKVLGLRWLPADTEMIVHAKVADIWQAPLLKGLLIETLVKLQLEAFEKQTGMVPTDVESITFGVSSPKETKVADAKPGFNPAFMPGTNVTARPGTNQPVQPGTYPMPGQAITPVEQHFVLVVKTKKPVDLKTIAAGTPGTVTKESHGKTYYEAPASPPMPSGGWWSPEPNTLVAGTTKELLATLERGETVTPRIEFAAIDHLPQLVIATMVPDIQSDARFAAFESQPWFATARDNMKAHSPKLVTIGLSVRGGFDLEIAMLSGTSEGAKKTKYEIESNIALGRKMFEDYKKAAPPLFAKLGDMLLTNLKVDEQNQTVKVSTSVPDSAQADLVQLPPLLTMMAMAGGLGQVEVAAKGGTPESIPGTVVFPAAAVLKLPGESDSVESTKATGLEDGMVLSAKTASSHLTWITPDGATAKTIDIILDVQGTGIETVCASTGVIPTSMTLEAGKSLKKIKPTLPGSIPDNVFRGYDSADNSQMEHPPQTLRVKLTVEAPKSEATKINSIEGSFRFLTAESSQEYTIDNVTKKANHPLAEPEFKAASLQLQYNHTGQNNFGNNQHRSLTLSCGKDHFIGRVRGTPGDVTVIPAAKPGRNIQQLQPKQGGQFTDDFQLYFTLYSETKEHVVTFRFEDVPLPTSEPGSRPLTPGQQPDSPRQQQNPNPIIQMPAKPADNPTTQTPQSPQPPADSKKRESLRSLRGKD